MFHEQLPRFSKASEQPCPKNTLVSFRLQCRTSAQLPPIFLDQEHQKAHRHAVNLLHAFPSGCDLEQASERIRRPVDLSRITSSAYLDLSRLTFCPSITNGSHGLTRQRAPAGLCACLDGYVNHARWAKGTEAGGTLVFREVSEIGG